MKTKSSGTVIIDWKPDKGSDITLTKQIIGYLKGRIAKGDWLVGQKLPSQRKLAQLFDVNRSTIAESLSELSALGIVDSSFGKGTTIINNTWSLIFAGSTPDWNNYIEHGIHRPNNPTIQAINKFEFFEPITRLGTGEMSPDEFPCDLMASVLKRVSDLNISYNYLEPLGLYELRAGLCKYLKKFNLSVEPSQVLIVSGSLQALQLISLSILGPNSVVLVEEPSYIKSLRVFDFSGITMKNVPMDKDGIQPWMIDDTILKKGMSILYTIPTFHNPTGITMSENRRSELLRWCRLNQLPIIEDDVYRELYFDDPPPFPIKSIDTSGNVLYLGSVSKSLAPGFRIGWIIGPESIVERLGDIKMQTDYGSSSLSQWIMTEWFASGLYEVHIQKFRKQLKKRCFFMLRLLDMYFSDIATWNIPKGGFYIWLKINKSIPIEKVFHHALKDNILINPGDIYSFKKNNCIRLSYSYASNQDMEDGLIKLSNIIRKM
ncbi:aminotransferase-like domain-containing protein [Geosporobacter ferrireducens]|uniref:HTH-type transcriptional regulator NorG n=1 Tax=Geosporobacter ferrireducens TaxID=1424294 RepID=A0A1D8GEF6_9FIRM|nr:PLP-dependent aminotransferase family protein [Geosporobacter ferrireducens]AOT69292.1 GntR family transcriptional regulator [Geosporobacter ferrireducens]